MAKVTLQPPFISFRGRVGDLVFRTYPDGQVIVSRYPDMSRVVASPAQKEHRLRFKAAIAYAKAAMAEPDVAAIYRKRAAEQDRVPFRIAVSDYFKGKDLLAEKKRAGQRDFEASPIGITPSPYGDYAAKPAGRAARCSQTGFSPASARSRGWVFASRGFAVRDPPLNSRSLHVSLAFHLYTRRNLVSSCRRGMVSTIYDKWRVAFPLLSCYNFNSGNTERKRVRGAKETT